MLNLNSGDILNVAERKKPKSVAIPLGWVRLSLAKLVIIESNCKLVAWQKTNCAWLLVHAFIKATITSGRILVFIIKLNYRLTASKFYVFMLLLQKMYICCFGYSHNIFVF